MPTVWMKKRDGEPQEFPYEPSKIAALMNAGWKQCDPPVKPMASGSLPVEDQAPTQPPPAEASEPKN